jgi:hypothetical protein
MANLQDCEILRPFRLNFRDKYARIRTIFLYDTERAPSQFISNFLSVSISFMRSFLSVCHHFLFLPWVESTYSVLSKPK